MRLTSAFLDILPPKAKPKRKAKKKHAAAEGVTMGWFTRRQKVVDDANATKTFWLSFVDEETNRNLGVCVIDVPAELAAKAAETAERTGRDPAMAWTVAAIGLSLFQECNPGGNLQAMEVDPARLPGIPRNRLIQEDELQRNGWA